jgi:muramoyltetrapeptide carboxypeptidase
VGKTCYGQDGYLAESDEVRATELMEFFENDAVKAIVTMRGGWGCQRILDALDYKKIRANPKVIIGFSDITSLVNAIYKHTGLITYHGPCGYSSWGDFTMKCVKKALVVGEPFTLKNPAEYEEETKTWVSGKAQGPLIGGNLTVLTALIGTKHEPNWTGAILFLEEIGEEPYRVDRMLWQMRQAGAFELLAGLVFGSFKNCQPEEPHRSFSLHEVSAQHFTHAKFPIYQGAAFGHIAPKFTLPVGVSAEIDADQFTIRMLERSVSL